MRTDPVLLAGAGPAGLAAAIQLRRSGIEPFLLERDEPGGLLRDAGRVENYLGFPGGIEGPELAARMSAQAERAGVRTARAEATALREERGRLVVDTTAGTRAASRVVIATGTVPRRWTGPSGIEEGEGRILSGIRSIRDRRDLRIAVIGAGDAAFDYALTLARGNDVRLLNRGKRIRCLPLLRERAFASDRIRYEEETEVATIRRNGAEELVLERRGRTTDRLVVDYVVTAIGRDPNLGWTGLATAELSSLADRGMLFPVGDAVNGDRRQASIAAGQGVRAAMLIAESLREV